MTTSPPQLNPDPLPGVAAELSKRLDAIEHRLDRIETHQREGIAALRQDIAVLRQDMQRELVAVNRRIDWLIGLQIGTFVALVGLLVSILLKG